MSTVEKKEMKRGKRRRMKRSQSSPNLIKPAMPAKTWVVGAARAGLPPPTKKQLRRIARNALRRKNGKGKGSTKPALPDARTGQTDDVTQVAGTKTPTVTVLSTGGSFVGLCLGYVSAALQRGYMSFANPDFPFWAHEYMKEALINYANGTNQTVVAMPYWFLCLCQAITPKSVPYQRSRIAYTFDAAFSVGSGAIDVGPSSYGEKWYAYVPGSSVVNHFPAGVAPTAYTTANGELAWASLGQFMVENKPDWRARLTAVVPSTTKTSWSQDVSCYAASLVAQGGGQGSGGWAYQAQHEVPVHAPALSCFIDLTGTQSDATDVARWPTRVTIAAGDATVLAGKMSMLQSEDKWKSKIYDVFKAIDFLQGCDIMAQALGSMLTAYAAWPDNNVQLQASNPTFLSLQCPLSMQEFQILFRNEVSYALASSIPFTQTLYPALPSSGSINYFMAYIYGSNTIPISSCGMKLPTPMIENIKSFVSLTVDKKNGNGSDQETWWPVLGQYFLDVLNPADYTYSINFGADQTIVTQPVFNPAPTALRRRKDSKTSAVTWEKTMETTIDLISGTAAGVPIFINDPVRLGVLAALWNDWIKLYSNCIDPLSTISAGTSCKLLSTLPLTRHWGVPSSKQRAREAEWQDVRLLNKRQITATPYATREVAATTSQGMFLAEAWSEIQSQWWLPVNFNNEGTGVNDQTDFPRMQLVAKEPFVAPSTSTGDGQTMATINMNYATKITHSFNAEESDWARFFKNEDATGHGGFLSGLVAQLAGHAFGSGVGSVASTIADMLPV